MFPFFVTTQAGCRRSFPRHLLHRITTLTISTAAVLVAQVIYTQPVNADRASRPNIVLIMADDMGYECIGANGSLDYQTPNLDKLAESGVRFEHCYSQPLCTPSRVKLMTGMSNKRNYVRFGLLDRGQTTFAHILREAGYRTCIAGKWQLGQEPDSPRHFGFEQSLLWQHTRGRIDTEKHDTRYPNPRLELNSEPVDYEQGEFSSDLFVEFISKFMEANRDRPFLVYYPMALVHCPFSPTPDSEAWDPRSRGATQYKGDARYFADMVAYTDKTVGRLAAKLEELGLRENTLLVFTGDNGTDTPIVTRTTFGRVAGAKGSMADGGNRVPCIMRWPDVIAPGRVSQDIIDFSDFLPTMCQATAATIPRNLPIDGRSFLPQLKGEAGTPRASIYMWYSRSGDAAKAKVFARNQQFKLYEDGRYYDVKRDRLEKTPLDPVSLSQEAGAVKKTLQAHIDSFSGITPKGARSNRS